MISAESSDKIKYDQYFTLASTEFCWLADAERENLVGTPCQTKYYKHLGAHSMIVVKCRGKQSA
jgi:hypothetical protein